MILTCLNVSSDLSTIPAAVTKHFDDFQEDQFDFHSYCLRKVTLRAYISVLRYEDVVYGHDFFCQAAEGIIRIYLHLYDKPACNETEEPDYSKMSAADRKKAKAIARKKKKASEKKEEDKKTKEASVENGNKQNQKLGKNAVVDEDPLGKEYLKKDPLSEAKKYSLMLAKYAPKNLRTWILQYDVAMRRKKPMLAMQALFKARSLDPDDSELFLRTVDFAGKRNDFRDTTEAVRSVLVDDFPALLENQSVGDFINKAASKIREMPLTDLPMRTAVVKAIADTKHGSLKEALPLITDGGIDSRNVTVETSLEALNLLSSLGAEADDATKQWTDTVQSRFPIALSS